ncbi:MAG: hypothetical protein MZU84_07050 [Sphingobacterium sp.]|nr:hypothetical protein [Sphingobacterium sp.]
MGLLIGVLAKRRPAGDPVRDDCRCSCSRRWAGPGSRWRPAAGRSQSLGRLMPLVTGR